MKTYPALWGNFLKWSSAVCSLLMLVPVFVPGWYGWIAPLVILACVPFVIRGYSITSDAILIRRLFWTTRLDRAGLLTAEPRPRAMKGSIRTFGNGGAFSITGWFWSKSLGRYRAFVTDMKVTVVLRFNDRTVVLSPSDPDGFAAALQPVLSRSRGV